MTRRARLTTVLGLTLASLTTLRPVHALANSVQSYANIFFEPADVLQTDWFAQSHWSRRMAQWWATQLLESAPWSVTNKTILPRSNDTHDYLSYAVYFWPNCSNVGNTTELTTQQVWDECDYKQRDGVFNPDIYLVQNDNAVNNMTDFVYLASLTYASTRDPQWSTAINDVLHTFFVNNSTRMNPNLNYAQVVRGPGAQLGKHTGVLDMKGMAKVVSGVMLLRELNATEYAQEVDDGLVSWAGDMVTWLETSEQGLGERNATNNHGTFYYNQLCALYVLLGQNDKAISLLEEFYQGIYLNQIIANGDQPLESARTRPYHYRAYNLAALTTLARIGDYVGLNPPGWTRPTAFNTTMIDALSFAMAQDPSLKNETDQVKTLNPTIAAVVSKFGDPDGKYAQFLKSSDEYYPGQVWFALNTGVGNSGIHQGLIETTYSASSSKRTGLPRARSPRRLDRRP